MSGTVGIHLDVWRWTQKNLWFSRAISELKWTTGFILYSFEVLIRTIELQSMSLIGPLVVKIDDIENSATHISAKSSQTRLDQGVPNREADLAEM